MTAGPAINFLSRELVGQSDFTTLTPCPTEFQCNAQTRRSDCVWQDQAAHDSRVDILFVLGFQNKSAIRRV